MCRRRNGQFTERKNLRVSVSRDRREHVVHCRLVVRCTESLYLLAFKYKLNCIKRH